MERAQARKIEASTRREGGREGEGRARSSERASKTAVPCHYDFMFPRRSNHTRLRTRSLAFGRRVRGGACGKAARRSLQRYSIC